MKRVLWFLMCFTVAAGCKSTPGAAAAKEGVEGPAGAAKTITAQVKRAFGKPPVPIRVALPATWKEGTHDEVVRLLPKVQPDRFFQTKLQIAEGNTSCQGKCDTKQVAANIKAVYEGFKERLLRPNRNTGDAKKDAYRAKVEVLEDTEKKGDVYSRVYAAKVTCPNKGTIPCMAYMAARCFHYKAGADHYLVATGKGPIAAETRAWPELMKLCRGVKFSK